MARTPVTSQSDLDSTSNKGLLRMSNEEAIERRRLQVIRMRLEGLTAHQIATELNYSINTIYSDIKAIRESNSKYVEDFDQKNFIGDTLSVYSQIENEAWSQVSDLPSGDIRKAKFLDSVRQARGEKIKLLQNSGLLHKEAEKVEVQVTTAVIEGWSEGQRQLVASAIIEASIEDAEVLEDSPLPRAIPREVPTPAKVRSEEMSDD